MWFAFAVHSIFEWFIFKCNINLIWDLESIIYLAKKKLNETRKYPYQTVIWNESFDACSHFYSIACAFLFNPLYNSCRYKCVSFFSPISLFYLLLFFWYLTRANNIQVLGNGKHQMYNSSFGTDFHLIGWKENKQTNNIKSMFTI